MTNKEKKKEEDDSFEKKRKDKKKDEAPCLLMPSMFRVLSVGKVEMKKESEN